MIQGRAGARVCEETDGSEGGDELEVVCRNERSPKKYHEV